MNERSWPFPTQDNPSSKGLEDFIRDVNQRRKKAKETNERRQIDEAYERAKRAVEENR